MDKKVINLKQYKKKKNKKILQEALSIFSYDEYDFNLDEESFDKKFDENENLLTFLSNQTHLNVDAKEMFFYFFRKNVLSAEEVMFLAQTYCLDRPIKTFSLPFYDTKKHKKIQQKNFLEKILLEETKFGQFICDQVFFVDEQGKKQRKTPMSQEQIFFLQIASLSVFSAECFRVASASSKKIHPLNLSFATEAGSGKGKTHFLSEILESEHLNAALNVIQNDFRGGKDLYNTQGPIFATKASMASILKDLEKTKSSDFILACDETEHYDYFMKQGSSLLKAATEGTFLNNLTTTRQNISRKNICGSFIFSSQNGFLQKIIQENPEDGFLGRVLLCSDYSKEKENNHRKLVEQKQKQKDDQRKNDFLKNFFKHYARHFLKHTGFKEKSNDSYQSRNVFEFKDEEAISYYKNLVGKFLDEDQIYKKDPITEQLVQRFEAFVLKFAANFYVLGKWSADEPIETCGKERLKVLGKHEIFCGFHCALFCLKELMINKDSNYYNFAWDMALDINDFLEKHSSKDFKPTRGHIRDFLLKRKVYADLKKENSVAFFESVFRVAVNILQIDFGVIYKPTKKSFTLEKPS